MSIESSANAMQRNNVQEAISCLDGNLRGKLSDGYHTFDQLYEHRCLLWILACNNLCYLDFELGVTGRVWFSKKHSDGTEWDGWFLLGVGMEKGEQITYHLPIKYWNDCRFATCLETAPEFDGHTSEDVLLRLAELIKH